MKGYFSPLAILISFLILPTSGSSSSSSIPFPNEITSGSRDSEAVISSSPVNPRGIPGVPGVPGVPGQPWRASNCVLACMKTHGSCQFGNCPCPNCCRMNRQNCRKCASEHDCKNT